MRISLFSNSFNAHQLPIALELYYAPSVEFHFVSLARLDDIPGRSNLDFDYPFVIREYESQENADHAMALALNDDIVIFGSMEGKEHYVEARAATGRHFFRYAERLLKRGDWMRLVPQKRRRVQAWFGRYAGCNMHVLCASAYTSRDLALFGFPESKCLKWGYFPEIVSMDTDSIQENGQRALNPYRICSAQRLISWKRVEIQLRLAMRLKREGVAFSLTILGDGAGHDHLVRLAHRLNVEDHVLFAGNQPPEYVQHCMRESLLFLGTSSRMEGWGATINEAMANGCCVVASRCMGSVPYLIEDGVSGFSFDDRDEDGLLRLVLELLNSPERAREVGAAASMRVTGEWSAKEAARRLLEFYEFNFCDKSNPYRSGPLSPAPVLEG